MDFHPCVLLPRAQRILEDPWVHNCLSCDLQPLRRAGKDQFVEPWNCVPPQIKASSSPWIRASILHHVSTEWSWIKSSSAIIYRSFQRFLFFIVFIFYFSLFLIGQCHQTIVWPRPPPHGLPSKKASWIINQLKSNAEMPKGRLQCKESLWFKIYTRINIIIRYHIYLNKYKYIYLNVTVHNYICFVSGFLILGWLKT